MWLIDKLAEKKTQEAMQRGEFDQLQGQGEPLKLEDDVFVPEELRTAYRLLKNAGYLPKEISLRKEIASIESLLQTCHDDERKGLGKRLNYLLMQLGASRPNAPLFSEGYYLDKLRKISVEERKI